jgi:hypothetical protein
MKASVSGTNAFRYWGIGLVKSWGNGYLVISYRRLGRSAIQALLAAPYERFGSTALAHPNPEQNHSAMANTSCCAARSRAAGVMMVLLPITIFSLRLRAARISASLTKSGLQGRSDRIQQSKN